MGLGIIVALPQEAQCLLKRRPRSGEIAEISQKNLVYISGMGAERARNAASYLLEHGATALMSWGTAAGLDPRIATGALVLPTSVISVEDDTFPVDPRLYEILARSLSGILQFREGALMSCATLLNSPGEKKALFSKTGAVIADMESVAIAKVAQDARVPFIAVRVVLDSAHDTVPTWVQSIVTIDGDVRIFSLLRHCLSPTRVRHLLQLRAKLRLAVRSLVVVADNGIPHISTV